MKILILEDDKNRIKWFKENTIGHSVDIVESAKPAIHLIQEKKYDVIFLDHDLGGEVYVDSNNDNTGYQVAKALLMSINETTPVVVHSLNSVGAKNIQRIIPEAEIIPFTILRKETIEYWESYLTRIKEIGNV